MLLYSSIIVSKGQSHVYEDDTLVKKRGLAVTANTTTSTTATA
jgi:hypothetical protein